MDKDQTIDPKVFEQEMAREFVITLTRREMLVLHKMITQTSYSYGDAVTAIPQVLEPIVAKLEAIVASAPVPPKEEVVLGKKVN